MPTKRTLAVLLAVLVLIPLYAFPGLDVCFGSVDNAFIDRLYRSEPIEAYTIDGESTSEILPDGTIIKDLAQRTENLDYAFSMSLVAFTPYSPALAQMTDSEKYLEIFNVSQSISTVKGVTYLSHSSGYKPEVLFQDAYIVSNPDKKNSRIADPVSDTVPQRRQLYAYLKDNRFGGNVYKIDYYCYANEIFLEISNVAAMRYMGFKCVDANALHMYLDACLTRDGVVVSGMAVVYNQEPQVNVLFTTVDLPSAFLKRVDSLKNWFNQRISEF